MERKFRGPIRPEVENPQPAGTTEKVGLFLEYYKRPVLGTLAGLLLGGFAYAKGPDLTTHIASQVPVSSTPSRSENCLPTSVENNMIRYANGFVANNAPYDFKLEICQDILERLTQDSEINLKAPRGHIAVVVFSPYNSRQMDMNMANLRETDAFLKKEGLIKKDAHYSVDSASLSETISEVSRKDTSNRPFLEKMSRLLSINWATATLLGISHTYNRPLRQLTPEAEMKVADNMPIRVTWINPEVLEVYKSN